MEKLLQTLRQFWRDEAGVTAIEYGLIAALIGVAILVATTNLGTKLSDIFSGIDTKLVAPK